jgi:hypothetical protein
MFKLGEENNGFVNVEKSGIKKIVLSPRSFYLWKLFESLDENLYNTISSGFFFSYLSMIF